MDVARIARRVCGLSLLIGLALNGCETNEDSSTATYDVTGTWLYSDTKGLQSTWAIVQATDGSLSGAGTGGETISGTVSADSVYVSLSYTDGDTAYLNGTVADSTMSGTGTYTTNSTSFEESWTAVKTN